jgi:hypothetical protein
MPTASSNFRVLGQSGKHLLVLSSSQFDPLADGNVHGAINLGSPAMRAPHRICNAGLDGAGSLQELLSVECECDAVGTPAEQFSFDFGFKRLD